MEDITVNQWVRVPFDNLITYDITGQPNGKLYRTYGIRIIEIGRQFVKVFSPDLNRNVFLRKEDLMPDGMKGCEQNV